MDDERLKELLQQEPSKGVKLAIDCYGDSVTWIVSKIIGAANREDIEECVADSFVRLWQNIERFDIKKGVPLKSYLYGIARYTALDCRRRNQRQKDWISAEEADLAVSVDFEGDMVRKINAQILQETIEELPSPDKDIFVLRYFLGERIAAIAKELSLTEKAVENKLYRGKNRLRKNLVEKGVIL